MCTGSLILPTSRLADIFRWWWRRRRNICIQRRRKEMGMGLEHSGPDGKWFLPGSALLCLCHIPFVFICQGYWFMYARRLYGGMGGMLVPTWVLDASKISSTDHFADALGDGGIVSGSLKYHIWVFYVLLLLDLSLRGPWVRISRYKCNRNR